MGEGSVVRGRGGDFVEGGLVGGAKCVWYCVRECVRVCRNKHMFVLHLGHKTINLYDVTQFW